MDQKTRTAKDLVIQMAGGREQAERIMSEVRENHRKLESCKLHDFSLHDFSIDLMPERPISMGNKWQCSKCGGKVDHDRKRWYELGLTHMALSIGTSLEGREHGV